MRLWALFESNSLKILSSEKLSNIPFIKKKALLSNAPFT